MMSTTRGRRGSAWRAGATAAAVTIVVAVTMAVAGCGSSASNSNSNSTTGTGTGRALTATTVLLDWFPNPDHIALYLAQKDGDFAAQGLSVTFQSPSDSTDALKLVSIGRVPLAISYEPDVITGATDSSMDVTAVGALIPVPLDTLIISGKSGVAGPGDLAGHIVGTDGDPTSAAIYQLILAKHGLRASKTTLVTVNEEGVPNYDELVVIANKSRLKSDLSYATMVREFLAGLAKGSAAAQASPAAADAALAPVAKGYSPSLLKQMVDVTAPLLANPDGFGAMSPTDWQSFATWMYHAGLTTKPVNVDASGIVNTSYLPKEK